MIGIIFFSNIYDSFCLEELMSLEIKLKISPKPKLLYHLENIKL